MTFHSLATLLLAAALGLSPLLALAQPKPRIEKAADLPRFTYKLDAKVEDVVRSRERFAVLAAQLRRDLDSVLSGYEIGDKAMQRDLIGQLAALDFLDGQYDRTVERAARCRTSRRTSSCPACACERWRRRPRRMASAAKPTCVRWARPSPGRSHRCRANWSRTA
jgi:hypothetical protein